MDDGSNGDRTRSAAEERSAKAKKYCDVARACEETAKALRKMASDLGADAPVPYSADLVRSAIRARRRRDAHFPPRLFGEPALDILLELFLAGLEKRPITIVDACAGAAVPSTTALRWLAILTKNGLVQHRPDPRDPQRTFVQLTDAGRSLMQDQFPGEGH
jgi:hypothetical protein